LKKGLATYFKKYAYQNTELNDFLNELGSAATEMGFKEDLVKWAESWLKTSGVNIISNSYEEKDGLIKEFNITQKIHKYGENRLRKQKFIVALFDENMNIYFQADAITSDEHEVVSVPELIGVKAPFAYYLNLGCNGFGKFKIDDRSIHAFEQKLSEMKNSMDRKLLYNILFDMMKDGDISGAFFL
jgi:aminopeptidase N